MVERDVATPAAVIAGENLLAGHGSMTRTSSPPEASSLVISVSASASGASEK